MAKMVGYACNVKLQWLNHAVAMLDENLTEAEYKEKMNEYLSFEIDSPTRLRKTREILMNVWYYDSEEITPMRQEALKLMKAHPECDAALHLCLMYLAYPVVADICTFMGRLFAYQDEVTNTVLNQKLYDEWGERTTLQTTCRRVTLTLKDMGILENETRLRYRLNKQAILNTEIVNFMLSVAMKVEDSGYYPFVGLTDFSMLFPFKYHVTKEQIMECPKFSISNFGGEPSVSLSDQQ